MICSLFAVFPPSSFRRKNSNFPAARVGGTLACAAAMSLLFLMCAPTLQAQSAQELQSELQQLKQLYEQKIAAL